MRIDVTESRPGDDRWPEIAKLFPRAVGWLEDPNDDGEYHFFTATDEAGCFLGGTVLEVGPLTFGPLADMTVGFIEDIEVLEPYRRRGAGCALLEALLEFAWRSGAHNVRSTVTYTNAPAIGLYRKLGFAFVPEEDPGSEDPQMCYTIVATNPTRRAAPRT